MHSLLNIVLLKKKFLASTNKKAKALRNIYIYILYGHGIMQTLQDREEILINILC